MNFRKYLFGKTVAVQNVFEVNTSLYICIEQLFELEDLLEKCVSSSEAQLSTLYTPLKEKISELPSNRVDLLGWLFFQSCCLSELYSAWHVD